MLVFDTRFRRLICTSNQLRGSAQRDDRQTDPVTGDGGPDVDAAHVIAVPIRARRSPCCSSASTSPMSVTIPVNMPPPVLTP
jgi:hypothetical protein